MSDAVTRRTTLTGLGAAGLAAASPALAAPAKDFSPLWPASSPPVLRGATIAQRRRRLAVDGDTFGGARAVLPVYGQRDFDALANAGANLVVMSYPELWTVERPWKRDNAVWDQLEQQLDLAASAGLYTIVGHRSGPGRSDFIFHRGGDWFPKELVIETIWNDREAQAAWGEMCLDTAKLLKGRKEAAGLLLMVEPENNYQARRVNGSMLGAHSPALYRERLEDVFDWSRIAGDIAHKVRKAAPKLPILISPPAYAHTGFLEVMGPPPVAGAVWCVHDWEPRDYTHTSGEEAGLLFPDDKDREFATRIAAAKSVAGGAPIFLGEFGASRQAVQRGSFHAARIARCEETNIAWSAFRWPTSDAAYERGDPAFDLTAPTIKTFDRTDIATLDALKAGWKKNTKRPRR